MFYLWEFNIILLQIHFDIVYPILCIQTHTRTRALFCSTPSVKGISSVNQSKYFEIYCLKTPTVLYEWILIWSRIEVMCVCGHVNLCIGADR